MPSWIFKFNSQSCILLLVNPGYSQHCYCGNSHQEMAPHTCTLSPSRHTRGGSLMLMSTPTVMCLSVYCVEPMPRSAPLTWCSWGSLDSGEWHRSTVKVTSPLRMSKSHVMTQAFWGTCTSTYKHSTHIRHHLTYCTRPGDHFTNIVKSS